LEYAQGRDGLEHLSADDWIKKKGKFYPRTDHEGPEMEIRYRSTLSLTLALDVGGWSMPRPGRFTPLKDSYPLMAG